jgi:hypothetical protein
MRISGKTVFLILLSITAFSLFDGNVVVPGHAAGVIYVSPSSTPTSATGSNITVQVQVANVDPFSGWDVWIRTDPSVLKARTVTIQGNLLAVNFSATMSLVSECVNEIGTGCGADDGIGIVHSGAAALGSRSLPPGPTSGLLFTITYTVLNGGSGVSAIEITRQIIVNGVTGSIVPVDVSNGVYGSPADFGLELNPIFGSVTQGGEMMVNATISSFNGFTGQVNLTADSLLQAYVSPTSVFLAPGGSATAQIFASTTLCDTPSTYGLGIIGRSGNLSHTFLASPSVLPSANSNPGFCISSVETTASVFAGSSGTFDFQLFGLNGFQGTVSMTVSIIPIITNGPRVFLLSNTLGVLNRRFSIGQIEFTTSTATPQEAYTMIVNATFGSELHFLSATLVVKPPQPTFAMNASLAMLTLAPGSSTTDTIALTSLFGFSAPVALGTNIQPFVANGPIVSLSTYTLFLSQNINSTLTVSAPGDTTIGSYNVTVSANGGGSFAFVVIRVNVVPLTPPGFLQFRWDRRVSVSNGGVETFLSGISNPNKESSIFVSIQATGIDSTGDETFTLSTGVIQLAPHQTLLNIPLTEHFSPADVGSTFVFLASILWSTSPAALLITGSSRSGVPASGTFTIVS